jgi:transcriptional regulator with XRE-family HTH domain
MSESEVFAANLRRLIDASALSERQIAERSGVSIKTLARWLQVGAKKPARRPPQTLLQLARVLDVPADELWRGETACVCIQYAERLRELISRWDRLGIDYHEITRWIDSAWIAACVADRFCREEADLAGIVAKVKTLRTEAELQTYLETMVREWGLDEAESYKRLVESTQKFVFAVLPRDPDQMGAWFRRVHPRRWANLLARRKLDDETELVALIRNLLTEGLSPHEAYEAIVRLSN